MTIDILMPALSPTMEEGTLAKWLVKEGDVVQSGDVIAEIETDKATMEFEAVDDGTIGSLLVAEGTADVKINTPIAVLLTEGESLPAPTQNGVASEPAVAQAFVAASPPPVEAGVSQSQEANAPPADRVFASPLARRVAAQAGLDLTGLTGSGPKGRIVKADVDQALARGHPSSPADSAPVATATPPAPSPADTAPLAPARGDVTDLYRERETTEIPLDGMRKTIAARLTEAKQTIPHFYLRREVRLDALLTFRKDLNAQLAARGLKISVNDLIIKACAQALQEVPAANAIWAGDRIVQLTPSDVAVAVAVDGGLFTPVLRDADRKPLSVLSTEMKTLAQQARDRKLQPHQYQGGSFAISNLGMFGIENFDAVINPPHGSILAVGAGVRKPVVSESDALAVATVMSLTLSVDHRVIDGALGAQFLAAIVNTLENPLTMLV